MNTAYTNFSQAICAIEELHAQGFVSFKLYRDQGMWHIGW